MAKFRGQQQRSQWNSFVAIIVKPSTLSPPKMKIVIWLDNYSIWTKLHYPWGESDELKLVTLQKYLNYSMHFINALLIKSYLKLELIMMIIPAWGTSDTLSSLTSGDVNVTLTIILGSIVEQTDKPASCGLIMISKLSADDTT